MKRGWDAIEKAKTLSAKTQRERDYIAALDLYYQDWDKPDYRTRVVAYEKAMEQVYLRYPEDLEAAVLYAFALNEAITVLPADKTYSRQLQAAGILGEVLSKQPDHPGALHYLIHSYDLPALATRGVATAKLCASVAPSAPHALHMPSHIYAEKERFEVLVTTDLNPRYQQNPLTAHCNHCTGHAELAAHTARYPGGRSGRGCGLERGGGDGQVLPARP